MATKRATVRWCAIGDTHGDMVDAETLRAFLEFVGAWKPTVKIHGGDVFDFRWLRRAARDEEKREAIESDVEAGCDLLAWYRPTIVLLGNHDDRLARSMKSDTGLLRFLCTQLWDRIQAATPGTTWLPYTTRASYQLGNFTFTHGFAHGLGATRKHAEVFGNSIAFHNHHIEDVLIARYGDGETHARGITAGCGCRLDMDYAASALNALRWENGWVYGEVIGERLSVRQVRRVGDGEWDGLP